MRTIGTADRPRRARTNQLKLEIVVGFDSEWVDASHADDGIPPNASNRILSWQLYLLSSSGECALLVEAKGGGKSSRRTLKTLLGMIVRKAIREGIIPSPPDVIPLAAHFSRADLSALRDFAKLKHRFSAVRRTYAYDNEAAYAPHSYRSGHSTHFSAARGHHVDGTCRCVTGIARCHAGCAKG